MSIIGEAVVEIALEDFWEFVQKYHPKLDSFTYGVPRVNKSNMTIEIDIAFGDRECHPEEWSETPEAIKQWKE